MKFRSTIAFSLPAFSLFWFSLLWFSLLAFSFSPLRAQWVQTNGPEGGTITSMFSSGPELLAGTDVGTIYRLSGDRSVWSPAVTGNARVTAFLPIGPSLSAATAGNGIFLSSDGGVTWSPIAQGPSNSNVLFLASAGSTLFAGTLNDGTNGGLFRSSDAGQTWHEADSNLPAGASVFAMATSGQTLVAGTDAGIFTSIDSGKTWVSAGLGLAANNITSLAANGAAVVAGTNAGAIFRSTDRGAHWQEGGNELTPEAILALAWDGNLYAGTANGLFRSTDTGAHWAAVGSDPAGLRVTALAVNSGTLFIGTAHAGIFIDSLNGTPNASNGIALTSVPTTFSGGPYLFALTGFGDVARSSDSGDTWENVQPAPARSLIGVAQNLVMSTLDGRTLHSSNNGTNWDTLPEPLGDFSAFLPNGTVLFAATQNGVLLSTDGGATWAIKNSILQNVTAFALHGSDLLAGTNGSGIQRSTDNGANWQPIDTGFLSHMTINAVAAIGNTIYISTTSGVLRTTNDGVEWDTVNHGLTNFGITAFVVNATNLFCATAGGGVFVLRTALDSVWQPFNHGLSDTATVLSLAERNSDLFAGTDGHGIWRRPVDDIESAVRRAPGTPSDFSLDVYPDPVVTSPTVHFVSSDLRDGRISIVNEAGIVVSRLASKEGMATWDVTGFPNGVYEAVRSSGTQTARVRFVVER